MSHHTSKTPIESTPSTQPLDVPRVAVWADAAHAQIVRQLLDVMSGEAAAVSVGGPPLAGLESLAHRLGTARGDDLRHMLVHHRVDFLLLATHEPAASDDLALALARGVWIVTLEPVAVDLSALASLQAAEPQGQARVGRIVNVPTFTASPGYLMATGPGEAEADVLGPRRMIRFTSVGGAVEGSLAARLLDAWRSVLHFADLPESIDASLVGPLAAVPDDLPGLTGRLAAHARLPGRGAALIEVSDTVGLSARELSVIAADAHLHATDADYTLVHPDGTAIDHAPPPDTSEIADASAYLDRIARQWRRVLSRPAPAATVNPGREARLEAHALACCLACLLSARTGEPETPQHLLDIFQR